MFRETWPDYSQKHTIGIVRHCDALATHIGVKKSITGDASTCANSPEYSIKVLTTARTLYSLAPSADSTLGTCEVDRVSGVLGGANFISFQEKNRVRIAADAQIVSFDPKTVAANAVYGISTSDRRVLLI